MPRRKITSPVLQEIEVQYAQWTEMVNGVFGVVAFTLGVACLGTSWPSLWASVSVIFVTLLLVRGQRHFPARIRALRAEELNDIDELTLAGIEKKYFGFKAAVTNACIYWFGFVFLLLVAVFGSEFTGGWFQKTKG